MCHFQVILAGMSIVSRDTFPGDQSDYKERICEETFVCITEGVFDLQVRLLNQFMVKNIKNQTALHCRTFATQW